MDLEHPLPRLQWSAEEGTLTAWALPGAHIWAHMGTALDPHSQAYPPTATALGVLGDWGSGVDGAEKGLLVYTPTKPTSGSLRRPSRGQEGHRVRNLSGRGSGRAAAESQPWVPYESALAGAPGTGGWGGVGRAVPTPKGTRRLGHWGFPH